MSGKGPTSQRSQLFLDTKDSCFLCLQECCSKREMSLRTIWQFLTIDPSSVLLQTLKENYDLCEEEASALMTSNRDVTVTLCSTCELLSTSLSKLISQLEVTKMLIDCKFQEFHQVLKTVQIGAWERAQKKMLDVVEDDGSVDVHFVKKLRLSAEQQSSQLVKSGITKRVPKLVLERLSPEKIVPRIRPVPPDSAPSWSPDNTSDSSDSDSTTLSNKSSPSTPKDRSPRKVTDIKKLFSRNYTSRSTPGRQPTIHCRHCYFQLPRQFLSSMERHIATVHPETLFVASKPPHLSTLVFRDACISLLSAETLVQANGASKVVDLRCPYCSGKRYGLYRSLRQHLVMDHFQELTPRLEKLVAPVDPAILKKPVSRKLPIDEALKLQYTIRQPGNVVQCGHCSQHTKTRPYMHNHLAHFHPELFLSHVKLGHTSDLVFKAACKGMLTTESALAKKDARKMTVCKYCGDNKISYLPRHFRRHLVTKHFEIMERKMMEYQKEGCYEEIPKESRTIKRKRKEGRGNGTKIAENPLLEMNETEEITFNEYSGESEESNGLFGSEQDEEEEYGMGSKVKIESMTGMRVDGFSGDGEEDHDATLLARTSATETSVKSENVF